MKTPVSFVEQAREVDGLVKVLKPTGSGPVGYKEFFAAVENLFSRNGWNYTAYVTWATDNYYARLARENKQGAVVPGKSISE